MDREQHGGWDEAWDRWTSLPVAACVLAVGLGLAAVQNTHLLNTDGVAYMRIGQYWATGQAALAVSGYWGPLLSWLMVPWLWLGAEPLVAARGAMAVSGLVFWLGIVAVGRASGLGEGLVRLGGWVSIPAVVVWSVENIVPDLLVGAGIAWATALQMDPRWVESRGRQAWCGAAWALAYLAKAIAWPLGLLVMSLFAGFWWVAGTSRRTVVRAATLTLAVFVAGCLPWLATLSMKYERPTFSTSGRIAHAVVGPPDVERSHPYGRTFHVPDAGRITVWEDPSSLAYAFWSPWGSPDYFRHQCRLVAQNARTVLGLVGGLGPWGLAYLGLLGCVWPAGRWREVIATQRWRWGAGLVMLLGTLYLPVYVKAVDQRYFQPAWPFVVMACLGAGALIATERPSRATDRSATNRPTANGGNRAETTPGANQRSRTLRQSARRWAPIVLGLWLAWPFVPRTGWALQGIRDPASLYAQDLAQRLRRAGITGPLAGNGLVVGGRVGLLTAFLVGQPWYGEATGAGADEFVASGARVIVVQRRQPVAGALAVDPRVVDLDPVLFEPGEETAAYLLRVFRLSER